VNERGDEWAIRRILVALDGSYHSLAALEAAAELAASLGAELFGLFVEDINLLRLASSPVAREVRYPFVSTGRLDRAGMERGLRAQAVQARRALAAACEPRRIKWSFRVARGEVAVEVLAAALEADLLTLGRASRPLIRRVRLGSTARAAMAQDECSVLLLQRDMRITPPVVVVYDGSPTAREALVWAVRLAHKKKWGFLTLLVVAGARDQARQLQTQVANRLRRPGLVVRYRWLRGTGLPALIHRIRAERSGVLILGSALLSSDSLQVLLDRVDCPVLLVRRVSPDGTQASCLPTGGDEHPE
jgi:nucleotide-binding universal stress UspA family protein